MSDWHAYFIADFEAGTLTWKSRAREHFPCDRHWKMWNTKNAGKVAGYVSPLGYRVTQLLGKRPRVHRVLWEMAYGPIPEGLGIDHIDRNKLNNRLSNLRLATQSENGRNTGMPATNTSGIRGVRWDKDRAKWHARIKHHRRNINLGRFATKGLAAVAYAKASIRLHGQFSTFTR